MYTGKRITPPGKTVSSQDALLATPVKLGSLSKEEAEGFFSNLVDAAPAKTEPTQRKMSKEPPPAEFMSGCMEQVSRNMNWNEGVERIIKGNLLVGNLANAVDCCLKCGRSVLLLQT